MKHSANYKWRLDPLKNQCRKISPGFRIQIVLAVAMIATMIAGLLYLVLDDRFFCLRCRRVELAVNNTRTSTKPRRNSLKPSYAVVQTQSAANIQVTDDEQQRLFSFQFSEQMRNRNLLMNL